MTQHKPKTLFIGCTHFGHAKIIELANRPFASVAEMDEALIDNWNRVTHPLDTVWHMGDLCMGNTERAAYYLSRLNGHIRRIKGNHDRTTAYMPEYMEVSMPSRKLVLFHYPIQEWNGYFRGAIHLHAHVHDGKFISGKRRFNVGADAVGFTPISYDQIMGTVNERKW